MGKVVSISSLTKERALKDKKVVLVGGTFDILHTAHLDFLEQSKKFGDILIVSVTSNKHVKSRKGKKRPIFDEKKRARLVSALSVVDYVFISDEPPYAHKIISLLEPDVLVFSLEGGKRLDRRVYKEKIENEFPQVHVKFLNIATPGMTTTKVIKKILNSQIRKVRKVI